MALYKSLLKGQLPSPDDCRTSSASSQHLGTIAPWDVYRLSYGERGLSTVKSIKVCNSAISSQYKSIRLSPFFHCLLLLPVLWSSFVRAEAQTAPPQKIADGVWFLLGDASKGYCNNIVIEMK